MATVDLGKSYRTAQERREALENGEGKIHDGTFVALTEISELAQAGQRLAFPADPGSEEVYLDDTRKVRVCPLQAKPR